MLLSRAADALYWMSRYVERAENIARFLDVNRHIALDRSASGGEQWHPLVSVTGDEPLFRERYGEPTRGNVVQFLTLDRGYANSVVSCIAAARENARTVRDAITSEMWRQLNHLHLTVQRAADEGLDDDQIARFCADLKSGTLLFAGIANATMSRTTAWELCRLGQMIERADKTSRILDVKYFLLLPHPEDVGTPVDAVQWAALLRSVGGLEMYRRHHGPTGPARVAGFLVLDARFPRSLLHCLMRSEDALARVLGPDPPGPQRTAARSLGRLRAEIEFEEIERIIARGLHGFIDGFQQRLNAVDDTLRDALFRSPEAPGEGEAAGAADSGTEGAQ